MQEVGDPGWCEGGRGGGVGPPARPGLGEAAGGSRSAAPPGGPAAARGGRAGGTGGPRGLPRPDPAGLRESPNTRKVCVREPGARPAAAVPRCAPARPRGAPGKRGWSRAAAFVRPLLQRRGEEREAPPCPCHVSDLEASVVLPNK